MTMSWNEIASFQQEKCSKKIEFGNAKIEELFINGILWSNSILDPYISKFILLFRQMVYKILIINISILYVSHV